MGFLSLSYKRGSVRTMHNGTRKLYTFDTINGERELISSVLHSNGCPKTVRKNIQLQAYREHASQ